MYAIYIVAVFIPILALGMLLSVNAKRILTDHYLELLDSDNLRVRTLMSEMAIQVYKDSEEICFDSGIRNLLGADYETVFDFATAANAVQTIDNEIYEDDEIAGIYVYTTNPTISDYKQYRKVTDEIRGQDWYARAEDGESAFWTSMATEVSYVKQYNLCLVRRMTLPGSDYSAVVVIRISDNYIRSRVDSDNIDAISVDAGGIVYSSKRGWYDMDMPVEIDYGDPYFSKLDVETLDGTRYFVSVSTLSLYKTSSKLYIATLDGSGFGYISRILQICALILAVAIVIPAIILIAFTYHFTRRVESLRDEMHKASVQDYGIRKNFSGNDEIAAAFNDLKVMVSDIKEKDAAMYEAKLNEKDLKNRQQLMEYKMLVSQINPHYLYNTLETIRMEALTGGDREVATAIKTLGKTLRYVLDNTGTALTALEAELDHVENYIKIQKLRFDDRLSYSLNVADGIDTRECGILPLLIQPVVENAIVHGMDGDAIEIAVSVAIDGEDRLTVEVSDTGVGISAEKLAQLRENMQEKDQLPQSSIGLYNINQRIRLSYGEPFGLSIESEEGSGTRVTLILPVIRRGGNVEF